jgi:hypothetical protein
MAGSAQAGAIDDVNSKLWGVWQSSDRPIILNDSNYSMYEFAGKFIDPLTGADLGTGVDYNGDGSVDESDIVIMGFIDFGDGWETGTTTIPPGLIRTTSGQSPSVDPDASPAVELSGWFAGVVIGGSPTASGISPEKANVTNPFVYLGAVSSGTGFDLDGDGTNDATWSPNSSTALVQLWADSANNFNTGTSSPAALYPVATDGTPVVEFGFRGTPADGSETAGTAYGAGKEYYALQFETGASGIATNFYASLNSVWTDSSSIFGLLGPNDTGNNFYATGALTELSGSPWKYKDTGGAEARIMILPLPSGALAGLALLGLLGFGRRIRRKKSL